MSTAKNSESISLVKVLNTTPEEMIKSLAYDLKEVVLKIKETEEKLHFFACKNATDIGKIARQSENPKFPSISHLEGSPFEILKPTDEASMNRQSNTTTFNVCGWCRYAIPAISRHNYMVVGYCEIKGFSNKNDEDSDGNEKYCFNTPCFLKTAPDKTFDEIRNSLWHKLEELQSEERRLHQSIRLQFDKKEKIRTGTFKAVI